MKRYFLIGLSLLVIGAVVFWFYDRKVDNFYLSHIYLNTWPTKEYAKVRTKLTPDEAKKLLDQPYTYLTKGRQFYTFASKDGKYVLKFIKCQRYNTSDWYRSLPLPSFLERSRTKRLQQKQEKIDKLFESCSLASTKVPASTGVLFVHLNQDPCVKKEVTIIDRAGLEHRLNIDEVPFVLQRRAELAGPTLASLIKAKDNDALNARLDQLVDLVIDDARHHIADTDDGFFDRDNIGFLPRRAIHLDIGTLVNKKDTMSKTYLQDCFDRYDPLVKWLNSRDRQAAENFRLKMQHAITDTLKDDTD